MSENSYYVVTLNFSQEQKLQALTQLLTQLYKSKTIVINIEECQLLTENLPQFQFGEKELKIETICINTSDTIITGADLTINFEVAGILGLDNQVSFVNKIDLIKGAAMAKFQQKNIEEIIELFKK